MTTEEIRLKQKQQFADAHQQQQSENPNYETDVEWVRDLLLGLANVRVHERVDVHYNTSIGTYSEPYSEFTITNEVKLSFITGDISVLPLFVEAACSGEMIQFTLKKFDASNAIRVAIYAVALA